MFRFILLYNLLLLFFFFNDTATTEIYTLSLHDALPILIVLAPMPRASVRTATAVNPGDLRSMRVEKRKSCHDVSTKDSQRPERTTSFASRSEEHTSELQSQSNLVCRLLLEKKKKRANVI